MRHSSAKRIFLAIVAAVALVSAPNIWAADAAPASGRGSVELPYSANLGGTQLQTGKYRVEWTGTGDQVEVKIYSGGKQVASSQATVVKERNSYDHLAFATDDKGAKSLTQISFAKQKCSLHFDNASASSDGQRAAK